ncbi:MAG: YdcF family protein [Bacillota bacterium]
MRKRLLIILIVLASILVTSSYWLSALGHCLVVDETPQKSDAIVILGGETVPRVAKGAELFREGYSNQIIMAGGGRLTSRYAEADLMLFEAEDLGVPRTSVILERNSESTYENAVFVKRIVQEKGIKSILLVTSNYHTRRARHIFSKVFEGTGVKITTVSAEDPKFSPSSWWKTHEGQQKALVELASMVIYWIKY